MDKAYYVVSIYRRPHEKKIQVKVVNPEEDFYEKAKFDLQHVKHKPDALMTMVNLNNGKIELDSSRNCTTIPNGKIFEKKKKINVDEFTVVGYRQDHMLMIYAFGKRDYWEVFDFQDIEKNFGILSLEQSLMNVLRI